MKGLNEKCCYHSIQINQRKLVKVEFISKHLYKKKNYGVSILGKVVDAEEVRKIH